MPKLPFRSKPARHPHRSASIGVALAAGLAATLGACGPGSEPATATPQRTERESSAPTATTPDAATAAPGRLLFRRILMGSRAEITAWGVRDHADEAARAAFEAMEAINAALSDYDPESEAMRLVRADHAVWHEVSPTLFDALDRSRSLWERTNGAFDPTVGPLTVLWRRAMKDGVPPDPRELEQARSRVGFHHIELDASTRRVRLAIPGMRLDFGGIGKGLAADAALEALRARGLPSALVDLGGDLAAGDPPPGRDGWTVAARRPELVSLAREAIATSGDTYRFIEIDGVRHSHVLDPATGIGVTHRAGATVRAPAAWLADAIATAACVVGPDGIDRLREAFPEATIDMWDPDAVNAAEPGRLPDGSASGVSGED